MRGEFKKEQRGNVFTLRMVHIWNELLEEAMEAATIMTFKRHMDRYMDRKSLEDYGQMQANGIGPKLYNSK